jgi:hypothetical protein
MDNMNVADIIQQAFNNRPQGVEDAFNNVIQQKMADAIETRRQEIANTYYGSEDEDETETEIEASADVEPEEEYEEDQVEVEEPTDEDV